MTQNMYDSRRPLKHAFSVSCAGPYRRTSIRHLDFCPHEVFFSFFFGYYIHFWTLAIFWSTIKIHFFSHIIFFPGFERSKQVDNFFSTILSEIQFFVNRKYTFWHFLFQIFDHWSEIHFFQQKNFLYSRTRPKKQNQTRPKNRSPW